MKKVKIKWSKLDKRAIIPTKKPYDAGYDIYGIFDEDIWIDPLETIQIRTGITCELSKGWHFEVRERGSTGNAGLKVSAGIMDNGYRGEYIIMICNVGKYMVGIGDPDEYPESYVYDCNNAIAQLILFQTPETEEEVVEYSELTKTERGDGMLGSSGK